MPKFDLHEYIAFVAKNGDALERLRLLLNTVQKAKHERDDDLLVQVLAYLSEADRSRFGVLRKKNSRRPLKTGEPLLFRSVISLLTSEHPGGSTRLLP